MAKPSIVFSLSSTVSRDQQEKLITELQSWSDVEAVGQLFPRAPQPDLLRMFFAYVSEDTEPNIVVERIQRMPEVERASISAERRAY
jgi:hypothetical protein